jgi:5-methylcytosine-specific restriction endonuclease McrA
MRRQSIRRHLEPYSIYRRRRTTVNHAFASAIAPADAYDDDRIREALELLGQDPDQPLRCVYCGASAETWDHVYALVRGARFSGYGHTLGNLLPCCRSCNSKKGSKSWREYLETISQHAEMRSRTLGLLEVFFEHFPAETLSHEQIEELCPQAMRELASIRTQILALMLAADTVAEQIQSEIRKYLQAQRGSFDPCK